MSRRRQPFRGVDYRSPVDADPGFKAEPVPHGTAIAYSLNGVLVLMPPPSPTWSAELRGRYLARRDANLFGICPACGAKAPAVVARPVLQHGVMEHASACPVGSLAIGGESDATADWPPRMEALA